MEKEKQEIGVDSKNLFGRMASRDRFVDIKSLIEKENPVIVDGGANEGYIVGKFLKFFKNPTIYAFEPIPDYVEVLKCKFKNYNKINIIQNALGASRKTVYFNILKNRVSSSILEPDTWNYKYHGEKMSITERIKVKQIRLDNLKLAEIDIIKLDLQGYELEALKGMKKTLRNTKIITTEVEFVHLYKRQPLFAEIDIFLRDNNFRLLNLYELWTHPDGQLTSGDAVYLNKSFYPI